MHQVDRHIVSPSHVGTFVLLDGFLTADQSISLVSYLDDIAREPSDETSHTKFAFTRPVFDGAAITSREQACAGWPVADVLQDPVDGAPLPPLLRSLAKAAEHSLLAAGLADLVPTTELTFTSVYVDRYLPGGYFVPHTDREWYGEVVCGVSAGPGSSRISFREPGDGAGFDVELPARSLYAFLGAVRRAPWVHALGNVDDLRYGITFRTAGREYRRRN